jgi:hypothetical protein
LRVACAATAVVSVPLAIEHLTGGNLDYSFIGLCSNGFGDTTCVSFAGKDNRQKRRDSRQRSEKSHAERQVAFWADLFCRGS